MTTPLPKATRDALLVTATAMLAPFRPQGDIDRAVDALISALENDGTAASQQPQDRLLSAREVGALLGRSTKTVRGMARRGLIRRVFIGARGARGGGYSAQSVNAFIAGAKENGEAQR